MFIESLNKFSATVKLLSTPVYNPKEFFDDARSKYGFPGSKLALEIVENHILQMHKSPWGSFREIDWRDIIKLKGLFASSSINTSHGTFIDQRYIDYLGPNFNKIEDIHWRKFEALTCEFLKDKDITLRLGPGQTMEESMQEFGRIILRMENLQLY